MKTLKGEESHVQPEDRCCWLLKKNVYCFLLLCYATLRYAPVSDYLFRIVCRECAI